MLLQFDSNACTGLGLILLLSGCATPHTSGTGPPDYLIVPRVRIGPVGIGTEISKVRSVLGSPDRESRYKEPYEKGVDIVWNYYNSYCLHFQYAEKGLSPVVNWGISPRWGITATCNRWKTAEGIHVGNQIAEVIRTYGEPDYLDGCNSGRPECLLYYKSGICFKSERRDGPITEISISYHPHLLQ